jgi:hypothetical protein
VSCSTECPPGDNKPLGEPTNQALSVTSSCSMFCARCPSLPLVMTDLCAVLGAHSGGKGCGCVPTRQPDGRAHGGAGGRAASDSASGDRAQQQPGSLVQPPLKIFLPPSLKTDRPPLAPLAAVETRSQNLIISLPPARHVVRWSRSRYASIRSLLSESHYPNPNYIVIRRACMSSNIVWTEPPTVYVA